MIVVLSGPCLQVVDLWPSKVARITERRRFDAVPLQGKPDATGPLKAIKGQGSGDDAVERAHRAHGLLVQALAELRPHFPTTPSPPPKEEEEEEEGVEEEEERGGGKREEAEVEAEAEEDKARSSSSSKFPSGNKDPAGPDDGEAVKAGNGNAAMSVDDNSDGDTEEEISATAAAEGSRGGGGGASRGATTGSSSVVAGGAQRGRKRRRMKGGGATGGAYKLRKREAPEGGGEVVSGEDDDGGPEQEENENDDGGGDEEEEEEGGADKDKDALGAAKMTVAAVRTSLLSNRSDDRPKPVAVEEWEEVVKNFILRVEKLPPGTEREELSLMFAAALDPTLVRMRAANASLVKLADECFANSNSKKNASRNGDDVDEEEEEEEEGEDDDDPEKRGKGVGGSGKVSGPAGKRKKGGFKVRLELDAKDGEAPPPDGIAGVLRAVAEAAAAAEAAAKAEACVAHAGDTLGGLRELRQDYKRSLPPGPREPVSKSYYCVQLFCLVFRCYICCCFCCCRRRRFPHSELCWRPMYRALGLA